MNKQKKIRLDELLVERGLFRDADEALRAVIAKEVRVGDTYATSAALPVAFDEDVFVKGRRQFVSRGGYKLSGALEAFDQDVRGMHCLDIGSSTGGFTDCLLQAGAAHVTCVDVNYGQLAWKLRQDDRVSVFERTNIKHAASDELGAPFDLILVDVSFIGLASLVPFFPDFCYKAGTERKTIFLGLIKPQFESQRGETDHGIVRDETVRRRTVSEVCTALESSGFKVTDTNTSPITGSDGNVEYFVHAIYCG